MNNGDRPQLHVSMLDMLSRCGIQFQRRYGARFGVWEKEEIIPPSVALAIGISTHIATEANLKHKMETGELVSVADIKELAFGAFSDTWQGGMLLSEEEALDQKKTYGEAADLAVLLSLLHHREFAPSVEPKAIEDPFVIELKNYPFDLAGKIDIVEEHAIGDVKTAAKAPNQDACKSIQMAMYAVSRKVATGKLPLRVYHQTLVKTKVPKAILVEATPEESWIGPLFRRIERFAEIVDAVKGGKQALTPANPNDWCCRAAYCGYAYSCKFWSGRA